MHNHKTSERQVHWQTLLHEKLSIRAGMAKGHETMLMMISALQI